MARPDHCVSAGPAAPLDPALEVDSGSGVVSGRRSPVPVVALEPPATADESGWTSEEEEEEEEKPLDGPRVDCQSPADVPGDVTLLYNSFANPTSVPTTPAGLEVKVRAGQPSPGGYGFEHPASLMRDLEDMSEAV